MSATYSLRTGPVARDLDLGRTFVSERVGEHRPVAIVGCGFVSPVTSSVQELVRLLVERNDAGNDFKTILTDADLSAASRLSPREVKKLDRFSLLGIAAARAAVDDAKIAEEEWAPCGVVTGNMMAGWTFTEPQLRTLHKAGPTEVSPYLATAWFPAAPQGQITIHLGMHGSSKTVTTDRCAGAQAIGMAFERIRSGRADLLLAGGVEAPVTPFVNAAFSQVRAEPLRIAEGAAYLVLSADGERSPVIGAHDSFLLPRPIPFQKEVLGKRIADFAAGLHAPPSTVVCNIAGDSQIEKEVACVIRDALRDTEPNLLFPSRAVGDCLAASGAIAAAIAYGLLTRKKPEPSVVVLSVGHQCGDLIWLHR